MIDTKAIREVAAVTSDSERMQFKPSTVIALLDRLEAAETEVLEQARLLGIGSEKELALMAKLEAAEKEAARYRWLRDCEDDFTDSFIEKLGSGGKRLEFAIDTAMKEQK